MKVEKDLIKSISFSYLFSCSTTFIHKSKAKTYVLMGINKFYTEIKHTKYFKSKPRTSRYERVSSGVDSRQTQRSLNEIKDIMKFADQFFPSDEVGSVIQ
jgi:hypothetical protein